MPWRDHPTQHQRCAMVRIDRLEEETRHLLKMAALIGGSFFYRSLAEVAHTIRNLDERLSFLKEIQLIRERESMEAREYLFKHALAQEAAYASILPLKRKRLHSKVAETVESVFAAKVHTFYDMLAYHYRRGENLDKAEEALIKAGEEALKTSASSEALPIIRKSCFSTGVNSVGGRNGKGGPAGKKHRPGTL